MKNNKNNELQNTLNFIEAILINPDGTDFSFIGRNLHCKNMKELKRC